MDHLFVAQQPAKKSHASLAVSAAVHVAAAAAIAAGSARVVSAPIPREHRSISFVSIAAANTAPLNLPGSGLLVEPAGPIELPPSPVDDQPEELPAALPQSVPEQSLAEEVLPSPVDIPSDTAVAPLPVLAPTLPTTEVPPVVPNERDDRRIVGSFDRALAATARPAPASVRLAGFEIAATEPPRARHSPDVQTAGFDRQPAPHATLSLEPPRTKVSETPVEVLFKPPADYTSEARDLHIEGEVVLEVTFGASNGLSIGRVVHGLGHGLDEAAARAVMGIRFRPATRDGVPVNVTALVRVAFQLT